LKRTSQPAHHTQVNNHSVVIAEKHNQHDLFSPEVSPWECVGVLWVSGGSPKGSWELGGGLQGVVWPDPNVVEARCDNGLVRGHAYSITRIKYCDIQTPRVSGKIPLVRIRNPWGNEAEWVGPWVTRVKNGSSFLLRRKKRWDFLTNFTMLEMTNLNPDSLEDEDIIGSVQHKWEMSVFEGAWIRGSSSGGCRNFLDTFWHNPQYRITLTEVDDDDDNKCTVIVALMQKNRRSQRKLGLECLTIGFAIYYVSQDFCSCGRNSHV
ncbi:hypothetical protein O3P69_010919, partial [Scylla paramamosain]